MPNLKRSKELEYKERDLGNNFKSVTDFLNYHADKMNRIQQQKIDDTNFSSLYVQRKKIRQILKTVHKARITTKQFRQFYANKFPMEK